MWRGFGGTSKSSSTKNRYCCCGVIIIAPNQGWIKVANISKKVIGSANTHVGGGVSGDHRDGDTRGPWRRLSEV